MSEPSIRIGSLYLDNSAAERSIAGTMATLQSLGGAVESQSKRLAGFSREYQGLARAAGVAVNAKEQVIRVAEQAARALAGSAQSAREATMVMGEVGKRYGLTAEAAATFAARAKESKAALDAGTVTAKQHAEALEGLWQEARATAAAQAEAAAATAAAAKAQAEAAASLEAVRRQYDPAYAALAKYGDEQERVTAVLKAANATDAERARILKAVADAHDPLLAASRATAEAAEREAAAQAKLMAGYREQAALARSQATGQAQWNAYAGVLDVPTGSAAASASVFETAARAAEEEAKALADLETRARALRESIDPAAKANRAFTQSLAEADDLLARGVISYEEHAIAAKRYHDEMRRATGAATEFGAAADKITLGLLFRANPYLARNIMDVGNVLVATRGDMASVIPVLFDLREHISYAFEKAEQMTGGAKEATEGVGELGGAAEAAGGGMRGMAGAASLSVGGLGLVAASALAVVAAIGGALAAQARYASSVREIEQAARLTGNSLGLTSGQFEALARASAEAGDTSVKAARSMIVEYNRIGSIGPAVIQQLIGLTEDYAVLTGQDAAAATKELAGLMKDPAKGAEELASKINLLSGAELDHIRRLDDAGKKTEAQSALTDVLARRIKGASDETSAWARAWNWVTTNASNAADAVGKAVDRAFSGASLDERIAQAERARRKRAELEALTGAPLPGKPSADSSDAGYQDLLIQKAEQERRARAQGNAANDRAASRAADEIAQRYDSVSAAIRSAEAEVTRLQKGLGTNMMADAGRGAKAVEALQNQISDLTKVQASGLDLQTYKTQELARVQQKYAGLDGPQYEAQKAAEVERINLLGTATTAAQRNAQVDAARTQVIAGQTAALAQQAAQYSAQVQGLMGVADAYQVSTAAGIEATARQQAMTEALSIDVDVATRTRELVVQGAAQQAASSAQAVDALNLEVKAQEDVAEAAQGGVAARIEAERQAQVAKQTHILLAQAEAAEAQGATDLALRLRVLAEGYDDLSKRAAKADLSKSLSAYGEQLATQRRGLDLDASLVGKPDNIRAIAKSHAQINELLISQGKTYDQLTDKERKQVDLLRQQATENATIEAGIARQQDAWNTLTNSLERAFDRVGDAIVEAMVSGQSETIKWRDIAESVVASIAADLAKLAIANPIKNALFGTNSGTLWDLPMFGGSGVGGGAQSVTIGGRQYVPANQNGGIGMPSMGGSGSMWTSLNGTWLDRQTGGAISDFGNWMSTPLYGGGGATATTAATDISRMGDVGMGAPSNVGGVTPGNMLSGAGYGLNAFMNFKNGNVIGGIGNTAATIMSFIPGLQPFAPFVAIGSQLLGSLFGPNPSTEYAGAWVQRDASGKVVSKASGADQTATDKVSGLEKAADIATSTTISALRSAGLKLDGNLWLGAESDTEGNRWKIGGWDGKVVSSSTDSAQVAVDVMRALAAEGKLSGDANTIQALQKSAATDAQGIMADMQFGRNFADSIAAMNNALGLEDTIRKQAKESVDATVQSLQQFRDKAKELGFDTDKANEATGNYLKSLILGADPKTYTTAQAAVITVKTSMEEWTKAAQDFGVSLTEAEIAAGTTKNLENSLVALAQSGSTTIDALQAVAVEFPEAANAVNKAVTILQSARAVFETGLYSGAAAALNPNYKPDATSILAGVGLNSADKPKLTEEINTALGGMTGDWANNLSIVNGMIRTVIDGHKNLTDQQRTDIVRAITSVAQTATAATQQYEQSLSQAWSKVASEARNAAQQAADAFSKAGDNLKDARLGLLVNQQLSPLSLEARRAEAFRQLYDAASTAKGSDQDKAIAAMGQIPQLAQAALQASKDYNASSVAYATDFETVQGILASTETVAQRQASLARDQVAKLDRLIGVTDSGLDGVESAIRDVLSGVDTRDYGTGSQAVINALIARAVPDFKGDFSQWGSYVAQHLPNRNADFGKNPLLNQQLAFLGQYGGDFGSGKGDWGAWFKANPNDPKTTLARELVRLAGFTPGFAEGGMHTGGLRLVGERGPELEVTGPARYFSAEQTTAMLRAANDRFTAPNIMEYRRPSSSGSTWDDSRLVARVDRLIEVNIAMLKESAAQREELVRTRAENAQLRRQLADAKMTARKTGTNG